jgi:DNA polymerase-4
MWGVGPVTQQRLDRLGVHTIGDLDALGEATLVRAFGTAQGRHLAALAAAIDDRPVEVDRRPKSIGHEETFAADLHTPAELHGHVVRLADQVASRLRRSGVAARTVTLKVRFAGFQTVTRSATPADPVDTGPDIVAALVAAEASIDPTPGVRLVGVSGSNLAPPAAQLRLDLSDDGQSARPAHWSEASAALDAIRERFGSQAIAPASTLGNRRRRPPPTR